MRIWQSSMTHPDALGARTVGELRGALAQGATTKFVFFWGHTAPREGSVSSSCLSQWFPARFVVGEVTYPTAEHYMMAEKARLFGDAKIEKMILAHAEPGAAKRFGRSVSGFRDDVWQQHRFDIAVTGNLLKFRQHPSLGAFLRSTAKRVLVEASPVDRIWGMGLDAKDKDAVNPDKWRGENLLGFALMEARERLIAAG